LARVRSTLNYVDCLEQVVWFVKYRLQLTGAAALRMPLPPLSSPSALFLLFAASWLLAGWLLAGWLAGGWGQPPPRPPFAAALLAHAPPPPRSWCLLIVAVATIELISSNLSARKLLAEPIRQAEEVARTACACSVFRGAQGPQTPHFLVLRALRGMADS
jgi:hypothetical protein